MPDSRIRSFIAKSEDTRPPPAERLPREFLDAACQMLLRTAVASMSEALADLGLTGSVVTAEIHLPNAKDECSDS